MMDNKQRHNSVASDVYSRARYDVKSKELVSYFSFAYLDSLASLKIAIYAIF